MINTIWSNRDAGSVVPISINQVPPGLTGTRLLITNDNAETGILPIVLDLGEIRNLGEKSTVEVEFLANGTAPGAAGTATIWVGFSSVSYRTPAQLLAAAVMTVCQLGTLAANALASFVTQQIPNSARYLYIWFDHTSFAAGSTLELTIRLNTRTEDS